MSARGVDIDYLNEVVISKSEPDNVKYIKDGVPWVVKVVGLMFSQGLD